MRANEKHSTAGLDNGAVFRWEIWREMYEATTSVQGRVDLLYRVTNTDWSAQGRTSIPYLLKEAEGHVMTHADEFFLTDEELERFATRPVDRSDLVASRQRAAQKAFEVLAVHLFKDEKGRRTRDEPNWFWTFADPTILRSLLSFFRLDEELKFVNFNYRVEGFRREVVETFLFTLASYGWENFPGRFADSRELRDRFSAHKADFVRILAGLGKLDHLLKRSWAPDEEDLAVLVELALTKEWYFPDLNKSMVPGTIEEAAYAGSQAGQVAIVLRERLAVKAHFQELRQREDALEAATQSLAEIQKGR